jgi:hypothetical protein
MAERKLYESVKGLVPRLVPIGGTVTIGASGAISAQSGAAYGAVFTQTASEDGRYTAVFSFPVKECISVNVNMVGPADNAFPATTGSDPQLRNKATTGFDIQTKRTDTQADADPASGSILSWSALVRV